MHQPHRHFPEEGITIDESKGLCYTHTNKQKRPMINLLGQWENVSSSD